MSNFSGPVRKGQSTIYQIKLKGHLGYQWTDWFEGLTITLEENGETLLTGPVVDQAALHGLLKRVRDLGMPLLAVNRIQTGPADAAAVEQETGPKNKIKGGSMVKYKRIVITRHGGPEVLQVVEDECPEPQAGQVRVKILAAGVANTDTMLRNNNVPGLGAPSPPYTPGKELVGVVDKLGEGVTTLEVGQTVASCLTGFGAYSEYVCAPEAEMTPVPPGLDPAEAVCLVANYAVAYQVLHRAAQVAPGERVLIHGAAGGIGTALLQLGQLAGVEMYGTASTAKQELIASLGATPIDYKKENFVERILSLTGDGVDVVCDSIGGSYVRRSYQTLRRGGRLVVFGGVAFAAEGMLKMLWGNMILTGILNTIPDKRAVLRFQMGDIKYHSSPEWVREDLSKLFDLLAQGRIKPIVTRMPLDEAARAHELIGEGAVKGKIVLMCNT